jgi:hypothetical protein
MNYLILASILFAPPCSVGAQDVTSEAASSSQTYAVAFEVQPDGIRQRNVARKETGAERNLVTKGIVRKGVDLLTRELDRVLGVGGAGVASERVLEEIALVDTRENTGRKPAGASSLTLVDGAGPVEVVDCTADVDDRPVWETPGKDTGISLADVASSMRGQLGRPTKNLTIGCMAYSYHGKRQRLIDMLTTWAQDCDRVYAFSDEAWEVPEIGFRAIEVHPDTGPETRDNLWRKTQQMWRKMATLWPRDNLDFLLVGGDDMFFIMPNVRAFLEDKSTTQPTLLGKVDRSFVSGAGYIVNKAVADMMTTCVGESWDKTTSAEDVMVGECLRSQGVDDPTRLASQSSERFCSVGLCRSEADTLLFHYIAGKSQCELFNAVYADTDQPRRQRMCATPAPTQLELLESDVSWQSSDLRGWTPRLARSDKIRSVSQLDKRNTAAPS